MSSVKKKRYIKGLASILCGILLGILIFYAINEKMSAYLEDEFYHLSRWDYFKVLLMSGETKKYLYLSKNDMNLMLYPLVFYIVNIIIASGSFLLKPTGYCVCLYARSADRKRAIANMKGRGMTYSLLFTISYIVMGNILSHFTAFNGGTMTESRLWGLLFLFIINSRVAVLFFREIIFAVYCSKGTANALLAGILFLVLLLTVDMAIPRCSMLLFEERRYFLDSIVINAGLYLAAKRICKSVRLPY